MARCALCTDFVSVHLRYRRSGKPEAELQLLAEAGVRKAVAFECMSNWNLLCK